MSWMENFLKINERSGTSIRALRVGLTPTEDNTTINNEDRKQS